MGRKKSHYKYFCVLYTKYGKVFYEKSFLHKGGYYCIIRQILTRKRAKSLILHIMKLHEISYNFYFTHNEIYSNYNKIHEIIQYTQHCIHQWGVIYANTHTIYYILTLHLYVLYKVLLRIYEVILRLSTNIIKIYHFSCNFCTFLYQN